MFKVLKKIKKKKWLSQREATGEIYKRNFTTFRCVIIYFDYLGSMLLIFFSPQKQY